MQKVLTFFRVFDLAFFVPGTVLLAALVYAFVPASLWSQPIGPTHGLALVMLGLVGAFSLGLWTHAVFWICLKRFVLFEKAGNKAGAEDAPDDWPRPPLPAYFDEPTRTDLLLYFWYLRATCWNLAFAGVVVGVLLLVRAPIVLCPRLPGTHFMVLVGSVVFALPLVKLGNRLNDVIEKSLRRPDPQPLRENDP